MKFNIIHFDEIDSTNQYCLKNACDLPDFSVITANQQTSGRGRKGRKWHSPKGGNLYFSLLIKSCDIKLTELSSLPQIMALSICESLKNCGIENSWIKWPNDVFVNQDKICGVLCETRLKGPKLEGLVIGVGLNVNMSAEDLARIDTLATSMLMESNDKEPFNSKETLSVILRAFNRNFNLWLNESSRQELVELWRQNSQLIGKPVKLIDDEKTIYGSVVDFTENGEIILQNEQGMRTYSYGDLSLRLQ